MTPEQKKAEAERLLDQGLEEYYRSQYRQALQSWQQALTIYQEIGDRQGEGNALNRLGLAYGSLGQNQQAIDYHQQALTIYQEIGDRSGEAKVLNNLGVAYVSLGQNQQAIDYHQQALTIYQEIGDRSGEGHALNNLGFAYRFLGQYQPAIDYYQQALTIVREIGDRSGEEAKVLNNLGVAYRSLVQNQQAIDYHQQALTISQEIGNREGEGNALKYLGDFYLCFRQYQQAIDYYQQALTIYQEIGDREGEGNALVNLGNAHDSVQYQQAIDYYQQALTIYQEIGNRSGEGHALDKLGNVYLCLRQYQQAINYHQQALTIARKIGNRRREGIALVNLGIVYLCLRQNQQVIDYYHQALTIYQEIRDRVQEGNVLGNLGLAHNYLLGQHQQAINYHQQALTISREIGDRYGEFYSLNNLASTYNDLLQIPRALEIWQSALALSSPLEFPVQYLLLGRNLGDTAFEVENWQLAITGYEAALDALEELCHRDRSDANKQQRRRENVGVYERLIQAYLHQNQIAQALVTLERGKSRSLIELLVNRDLLPKNTPPEICQRLEQLRRELSANQRFIESLGGDIPADGTDPDSPQSRSAGAVNIPIDSINQIRETLVQQKQELNQVLEQIKTFDSTFEYTQRVQRINLSEIPALLPEKTALVEWFIASERIYAFIVWADSPCHVERNAEKRNISEILRCAQNDSESVVEGNAGERNILEILRCAQNDRESGVEGNAGERNISEILRFAQNDSESVVEGNAGERNISEILRCAQNDSESNDRESVVDGENLVNGFSMDYWQSKPEAVTAVVELRDRYLKTYNSKTDIWENQLEPFLEELAEILNIQYILSKIPAFCQRLILVPYRELHLFPLHALPVAKDNGKTLCLFDKFSQGVQYLPSLQMGLMSLENIALREENPDHAVNNIQLFAIQNPTKDLDFAELEVDAIASQFTANILSREKATKIALTQPPNSDLFRDANYLHFACHGSFNFQFPLLSHLILAGGIVEVFESSDRQTQEELDSPETKRYLPWRKGKQVDTDQCYTLREIFSLDFPKGELVTLSACETGLTQFDQTLEEYISLSSGFLFAGVKNVICSLWRVSDLSTAILMIKFYELFRSEKSVSLALNQAQNWLRTVDKENLLKWWNALQLKPESKPNLSQELNLAWRLSTYQPFKEAYYWAGFCAIGK
ncbi:hypothetical protein PL8927_270041 [Planktothrix serta PCC 8927]|uniref:CHAT domain-containing protein n=1 Tax=Planktothrix serta PCC 8927 TaxID=671068 RepID=A0A7Z9DVV0_9CYAN|nr:tetratricopeptide repeat protein [Planktothrix serta]VXD13575.1 hypothetical protein PL8927_270041 [Planktothrix serta PCC 8927]